MTASLEATSSMRPWISPSGRPPSVPFQAPGHHGEVHSRDAEGLVSCKRMASNAPHPAGADQLAPVTRLTTLGSSRAFDARGVSLFEGGGQPANIGLAELRHARCHVGPDRPFR